MGQKFRRRIDSVYKPKSRWVDKIMFGIQYLKERERKGLQIRQGGGRWLHHPGIRDKAGGCQGIGISSPMWPAS